ncbi:MAG: 23S rRNA (guanosine(2251)-2'-O)-methyltransferase RlmB [Clostridiales bacterium]|jgi:23S rRNA (guanosine2251-2'-O)-methyltransferase|nr:23S rRNA (guanosine(2251)-2'-O)-methyltransferase RlmB [Clostridiales bacterium]
MKNNKRRDDAKETPQLILTGRNAILEALNHEKPIDKILLRRGNVEGTLRVIAAKARERGIVLQEVDKIKLDELSESASHQGVVGVCPAKGYVEIEEILNYAESKSEDPFVILLDGIMDPRNLGAILRSAEAAGVHGVILPKRRAVGLTSVVAKTSSGAIEHILISRVTNLSDTVTQLKKRGLWIACADMNGNDLYTADLSGPIALIIGSEGTGVGRLLAQNSDFTVKIPMHGHIDSLNASVAAGILMYEIVRIRRFKSSAP